MNKCFWTRTVAHFHDVEDWLNVENELPTSPQSSDEQILESVVGVQSSFKDESSDDEEVEG